MAAFGRRLECPTVEEIVNTNRRQISKYGGIFLAPDNIKEKGKLEWVLNAIQHPLFGYDPYPTLIEKAAILTWKITAEHTFWDGGKRTGMTVVAAFLIRNGERLNHLFRKEGYDVAILLADSQVRSYTLEDFSEWLSRVTR